MKINYTLKDESYKYKDGENIKFDSKNISLVTAKRDWAAFQILLQGEEEFILSVGENTVFSPKGFEPLCSKQCQLKYIRLNIKISEIPSASIKMVPIGLVDDDDGIHKADILLHQESIFVDYKRVQPVWAEVVVPEDIVADVYHGEIEIYCHTLFEDEKKIDSLFFDIDVKNVVLPKPEDFHFHLDLWQHLSNIARKHEVILWSDEHFKVVEEYVKSLGALGQKAITIIVSEIPWSGQGCFTVTDYISDLFEYNMVKVRKSSKGNFIYDFSIVNRYIELCNKYGINKEIEVFGIVNIWIYEKLGYGKVAQDYPDAIRIRYFDESDGCYKFIKESIEIKQYISALERFFINQQLIDKVRVVADEPADVELHKERIKQLRDVAPSFKYKAAINHAEIIGQFKDLTSDFVPALSCVFEEWDLLNSICKDISGRLLWYVCCVPDFPNTFIHSPLIESRFIGLFTAFLNFDGFLRWNYTVWPEKPREKLSYRYPIWSSGDTNFVYPANDGRPLLSLRYKNLKRGIEDFELIHMLKTLHSDADYIMCRVWDRLLKMKDIGEFVSAKGRKQEELYSLDQKDYQFVKTLLLNVISSTLCK